MTLRPMTAVDPCNFLCRNDILIMVTPGEYHEGGEGTDRACSNHPPDVPDQRKTHHGGEEGADEAGRRIARDLDIPIPWRFVGRALLVRAVLEFPPGVFAGHFRQKSKIEGRRRRRGGPFQRTAVPRVAG